LPFFQRAFAAFAAIWERFIVGLEASTLHYCKNADARYGITPDALIVVKESPFKPIIRHNWVPQLRHSPELTHRCSPKLTQAL